MNSANESLLGDEKMVKCDMCENHFRSYNGGVPERGMDIHFGGGYGLFHDADLKSHMESVILCHDCALVVIRMFPKFRYQKGWHSVSVDANDYPLCCEYSWTFERQDGKLNLIYGGKNHFDKRES